MASNDYIDVAQLPESNDPSWLLAVQSDGGARKTPLSNFATYAQGQLASSSLQGVSQGPGIGIDNADPKNPVIRFTGGLGGGLFGPPVAVDGNLPIFDGTSGQLVADSGVKLSDKADATALDAKADLDSPEFTGTPQAPTADPETDTDQIATTAFVTAAINAVPGGGDVTGPAGATAGNFPALDATGKILSDSGKKPADFLTLAASQTITGAKTISLGTAVTDLTYLKLEPTDHGTGKPSLYLQKKSTATIWEIFLWDGVNANGTINVVSSAFTWNGNAILSSTAIGSTVQGYDANTAKLNIAQQFTKPQRGSSTTLTSGTTITQDLADGNNWDLTLGHNATLANPTNQSSYPKLIGSIDCVQDGTGGRTLAFGSNWYPIGAALAPAAPTGINAKFRIDFKVVSSTRIDFKLSSVGV